MRDYDSDVVVASLLEQRADPLEATKNVSLSACYANGLSFVSDQGSSQHNLPQGARFQILGILTMFTILLLFMHCLYTGWLAGTACCLSV